MLSTGCNNDDEEEFLLGEIIPMEESELIIETTTKTNDSIATKTFNDKAGLQ